MEDIAKQAEEFILVDQQSGPSPRKLFDDLMATLEKNLKSYAKVR